MVGFLQVSGDPTQCMACSQCSRVPDYLTAGLPIARNVPPKDENFFDAETDSSECAEHHHGLLQWFLAHGVRRCQRQIMVFHKLGFQGMISNNTY
jgi:hypothetical protein